MGHLFIAFVATTKLNIFAMRDAVVAIYRWSFMCIIRFYQLSSIKDSREKSEDKIKLLNSEVEYVEPQSFILKSENIIHVKVQNIMTLVWIMEAYKMPQLTQPNPNPNRF